MCLRQSIVGFVAVVVVLAWCTADVQAQQKATVQVPQTAAVQQKKQQPAPKKIIKLQTTKKPARAVPPAKPQPKIQVRPLPKALKPAQPQPGARPIPPTRPQQPRLPIRPIPKAVRPTPQRPPTDVTRPRPSPPRRLTAQQALQMRVRRLHLYLDRFSTGPGWQRHLQLEELARLAQARPPRHQKITATTRIRAIAAQFDETARNPKYVDFFQRPDVRATHIALTAYVARLPQYETPLPVLTIDGPLRGRPRVPPALVVNIDLLKRFRAPQLKVWNGFSGDFEAFEDSVFIESNDTRSREWRFRWKHDSDSVARAIVQVTGFEPTPLASDWQNPPAPLATVNLTEIPARGKYAYLELDVAALAGAPPLPEPSTPSKGGGPTKLAPQLTGPSGPAAPFQLAPQTLHLASAYQQLGRRDLYLRVVVFGADDKPVGASSPAVRVTLGMPDPPDLVLYDDTLGPRKVPEQEMPLQVRIVEFAPIRTRLPDADRHWIVTGENHHGWPIGKKVTGDIQDLVKKSTWDKIKGAGSDAIEFVKDAANWVSDAYEDIKQAAVGAVASAIPGCDSTCRDLLSTGLDYGLTSVGIPPDIPDFDQLAEMSKGHITEVITAQVTEAAAGAGLPEGVSEELTEEVVARMVDEVIEQAKKEAAGGPKGFWLKPDPDYQYRPAYVRVAIRNPHLLETAATLSIQSKYGPSSSWKKLFRTQRLPLPRLRSGQTKELTVFLEQDFQAWYKAETQSENENRRRMNARWWDEYYSPGQTMTLRVRVVGRKSIGTDEQPKDAVFKGEDSIQQSPQAKYPGP